MAKMVVVLKWDEVDMGRGWMNIDNLKLCLYSKEHTNPDLLNVIEVVTEEEEIAIKQDCHVEQPL